MWSLVYAVGNVGSKSTSTPSGGALFGSLFPIIIIMVIFYILLIRPQQKQQKQHENMLAKLKKGDRVITSGGIHGIVAGINDKDNIVVLKISDNVKIEITKSNISKVKGTSV